MIPAVPSASYFADGLVIISISLIPLESVQLIALDKSVSSWLSWRIEIISSLIKENLYDNIWQAGAIFLPIKSVGVMGDERTYENVVALRAVESTDGMTADWVHLPYDFLAKVSNDIINKVHGVNRVVYDISSKPPATIEWE